MTDKSYFDAVFGIEEDITAVVDCTNVLVDSRQRDSEMSAGVAQGLGRVAWDARKASARLKGQCVSILAMVLGLSMALLLATAFITLLRALFGI